MTASDRVFYSLPADEFSVWVACKVDLAATSGDLPSPTSMYGRLLRSTQVDYTVDNARPHLLRGPGVPTAFCQRPTDPSVKIISFRLMWCLHVTIPFRQMEIIQSL